MTPATGVPSPEGQFGFDDALLTVPLPLAAYANLGSRVFARSLRGWPWRLGRLVASSGGAFAPALAGGLLWWLLTLDEPGRRAILATPFVFDDWLAARGVVLGASGLAGLLLLSVILLVARAMMDAAWFGTLRDTATGVRRTVRAWWNETAVVFFGLSLIRLGLFMGSLMFLSPFFRVAGRLAVHEGASFRTTMFIAVSIGVAVGVLAYLSFFLSVTATYLSYRPRFFAGTVVAGIAAPFRQWRQFIWIAPAYMLAWAAFWLAGSIASTDLAGAWFYGWRVPTSAVLAGVVAASGFTAAAWFDAFLAALVGHRLGDVGIARFESNLQAAPGNAKAADMPAPTQTPNSLRFEPPVRGLFVSPHGRQELHSVVPFSEIFVAEEPAALPATWTTGESTLDVSIASAEPETGAVAPEVMVQGGETSSPWSGSPTAALASAAVRSRDATRAGDATPPGAGRAVELRKSAAMPSAPEAGTAADVSDEVYATPFDELSLVATASRTTFRSASGALERSVH